MKVTNEILKYYSSLDRQFHFFFVELMRRPGEETIHDLRVNMKMQIAFFRLLEALSSDFIADKAQKAFAHFYKKAGRVRNLQVERKVIEAEEELLHLGRHLSLKLVRKEKMHTADLRRYNENYSTEPIHALSRVVKNHIQNLPIDQLLPRMGEYFGLLTDSVGRLSELAGRRDEELHNLRKHLKELYYNLELVDQLFPEDRGLKGDSYSLLEEMQSQLGDWHDLDFTLCKLDVEMPPEMLAQIQEERSDLAGRIRQNLPALRKELPLLDERLQALFASVRVKKPESPRPGGHRPDHSSVQQMNLGERYT